MTSNPSLKDAQEAVRTLLSFVGENPNRDDLQETPARFVKALQEHCSGYALDPIAYLSKTFSNDYVYQGVVLLKDIAFESMCEHHLAPIIGVAHVAYLPRERIVGLSKLARVVEAYSKRLQVQERMTVQIAQALQEALNPLGIAVRIEATHHCMATRGIRKLNAKMVTQDLRGIFQNDLEKRREILSLFS